VGGAPYVYIKQGVTVFEDNTFLYGTDSLFHVVASDPDTCQVVLERNLFVQEDGLGSFMSVASNGAKEIVFRNNTAVDIMTIGIAPNQSQTHLEIVNSVFFGRDLGVFFVCDGSSASWDFRYNCLWGTYYVGCSGPGNIVSDPMFCDPAYQHNDFTLHVDSPCIGAGEGGLNMGAFGVGCGISAISERAALPNSRPLTVEPNPVLHRARFTFDPRTNPVALDIYDPAGRLIGTFEPRSRLDWMPPQDVRSGVYFARLRGEGLSEVVKFIVLR
jgi:hypothetical protein